MLRAASIETKFVRDRKYRIQNVRQRITYLAYLCTNVKGCVDWARESSILLSDETRQTSPIYVSSLASFAGLSSKAAGRDSLSSSDVHFV